MCLLYYATEFLEMQAEIISFLLIGLIFTNACRLAASLELARNK